MKKSQKLFMVFLCLVTLTYSPASVLAHGSSQKIYPQEEYLPEEDNFQPANLSGLPSTLQASTSTQIQEIIDALTDNTTTIITIESDFTFTQTILIPENRTVTLLAPMPVVLTQENGRHFEVHGTLNIGTDALPSNITLNGNNLGGGIDILGGRLSFWSGTVIEKCSAVNGGGVYVADDASFFGLECTFKENKAEHNGGGLYGEGGIALLFSTILGNSAESGGGIYGSTLTFGGENLIEGNSALTGGGMTINHLTNGSLTSMTLKDNQAAESGGGIYITESSTPLSIMGDSLAFYNNNAPKGGGLFIGNNNSAEFQSSIFNGNQAELGGGIYIEGPESSLRLRQSTTMTFNSAQYGGGLYAQNTNLPLLAGYTAKNKGTEGGGLYLLYNGMSQDGSAVSISGTLEENTAFKNGGAVALILKDIEPSALEVEFQSALIKGNRAQDSGGGLYISAANTAAHSNTILFNSVSLEDNHAVNNGGGIYCGASGGENILKFNGTAAISANNAGKDGGGIYLSTPEDMLVLDGLADVSNNSAGRDGGAIFTPLFLFNGEDLPYSNLDISSTVTFGGNSAPREYLLPADLFETLSNIRSISSSSFSDTPHPVNNYDINHPLYLITYSPNLGKGTIVTQSYDTYGINLVLSDKDLNYSRTDYEFTKWNTSQNGGGTPYSPGTSLSLSDDITLYAQWNYVGEEDNGDEDGNENGNNGSGGNESGGGAGGGGGGGAKTYAVLFETNGGLPLPEKQSLPINSKISRPQDPEKEGYTFDGWYEDKTFQKPWNFSTGEITGSMILYAKWTAAVPAVAEPAAEEKPTESVPYIFGYPDGTFRPDGFVTRAEIAQVFYNLMSDTSGPNTLPFTDTASNSWYYSAVQALYEKGIVSGYPDNTYRPDALVSRSEFTVMAVRFLNSVSNGSTALFPDVAEDYWALPYISTAQQAGLINGFPDGTFRPEAYLTRIQAVVIMNRAAGRSLNPSYNPEDIPFTDVSADYWGLEEIMAATKTQ